MSVWEKSVTERDFRLPEYRDARAEDYEFSPDGKPVRKDRWIVGFGKVANAFGLGGRIGYEIDEVVERVRKSAAASGLGAEVGCPWRDYEGDSLSTAGLVNGDILDVRLSDGSVLRGVEYSGASGAVPGVLRWRARPMFDDIEAFRRTKAVNE